ncbi:hypothetical protein HMI54_014096 [Coelomomyces lativittatus]|nr:hypothetical protein HMI56_000717 [Coelomomyces lativittatus]KAJ1514491.1 hypothetical protein HMI54_014096 [Coelomomyces lativittatus]
MLLPSPSNPNEFKQAVRLTEFGSPMTNFLHEPNSTKPIFSHLLPLIGPGRQTNIDCITWSFLKKLSKDFRNHLFSDKKSHQQERKQFRKKKETVAVHRPKNSQIHIPSSLLLSKSTMQENSIPLHPVLTEEAESTYPEGWVHSRITSLCMENKHWRLLSIDCEMCGTKNGSELTRVSVMAHDGKVLLNEFVKPHNPILDYRTLYSGITSDHLENVTTRLADIQKQLFEIVDENSVLVGHSVENDLFALQFTHPYILDTSILYSPAPNVKLRLRSLSKKYLQREIQCSDGTNEGHCSLEDAEATLDLTLLKLKEDKEMTSDEKLPPFNPSLIHFLKTSLVPKTTTYINCKNLGEKVLMDEAQTLTYASIEDFLPTLQEALALDSQLIYAELPFLSAISLQSINEEEQKSIATTLQLISQVYEQLPTRTLFLVFSASTDLPLLEKAKLEFQHRRTNANNTEFIKFCKAVRKSKTGCALLRLKSFS